MTDRPAIALTPGDRVVSSQLVEVETFRAVDRERLLGRLDDLQTAVKRKELTELLAMIDLAAVDTTVIARAKGAFPVNVRALDAIHVATAEMLETEALDDAVEFWTQFVPIDAVSLEHDDAIGRPIRVLHEAVIALMDRKLGNPLEAVKPDEALRALKL